MKLLVRQLRRWRLRERLVRLAWGGSRWVAAALAALAVACFIDWYYDRFDDTPMFLRVLLTAGQLGLAAGLAYLFLVRPWLKTPPLDELAYQAEKAIPEFDHRLVTALQLNRRGAKTQGMSQTLIAEVTREAGEMAAHHRLTRLVNYRPVLWGLAVVLPALLAAGVFAAVRPELTLILLKRQILLSAEIPRSIHLENVTQEIWPTGAEVTIRYQVTGDLDPDRVESFVGKVFVFPDGQPADEYPLTFEAQQPDGSATFISKLPPSSLGFSFRARLRDGRTRTDGRVEFEPPPQVKEIEAWQLLPKYLGLSPDGGSFERHQPRGEVVNALPMSGIRVKATFNKPVVKAVLVPIERGDANKEVDGKPLAPEELAANGEEAEWVFPATQRIIGYRIELTDARGFTSPAPARRGVRMLPDEPAFVEFKKESNRNPDPTAFDGKGDPRIYEWDIPVSRNTTGETGPIPVIYHAHSELGIGQVNLAYRVVPRGEPAENVHPRDDLGGRVYTRLPLKDVKADVATVGKFVPDLGLFEKSFLVKDGPPRLYLPRPERPRVQVELYKLASPNPATEPAELAAGGRVNFQTAGLSKPSLDGTATKLDIGDTVELYVEVYDKFEGYKDARGRPISRPAGYTREAKRKTIVTEEDAYLLTRQRDEAQKKLQDKLRELRDDQFKAFETAPGGK